MNVYVVYTSDYHHCNEKIIKGFTDLEKAIEFAADVVVEKNRKYNRDFVKETIRNSYRSQYICDLFVYTDYCDMDYDEFVGITTIEVEWS